MKTEKITITLSREMAIALFEWSYRYMETFDITLAHPADAIVIDKIASELEWSLKEPFSKEYGVILQECRNAVLEKHLKTMNYTLTDCWLSKQKYQDFKQPD